MLYFKSKKINDDGSIEILTEEKYFFNLLKKERKFITYEKYVSNYYKWLELPYKRTVYDNLSFQLDDWNKYN